MGLVGGAAPSCLVEELVAVEGSGLLGNVLMLEVVVEVGDVEAGDLEVVLGGAELDERAGEELFGELDAAAGLTGGEIFAGE